MKVTIISIVYALGLVLCHSEIDNEEHKDLSRIAEQIMAGYYISFDCLELMIVCCKASRKIIYLQKGRRPALRTHRSIT